MIPPLLVALLSGCEAPPAEAPAVSKHAGSAACAGCHPAPSAAWADSHHARAQRSVGEAEAAAMVTGSRFQARGESLTVDGAPVVGVIGVHPLWQPLVEGEGGRLQVLDLAWDVEKGEWFSVFSDPRVPGDWGHWTGRGMTWNSMCAACHNTALSVGYDAAGDRYETTEAEVGVGCEACHGPASQHAADPGVPPPQPAPGLSTCAPCHSRRASLTDGAAPGEPFSDHYALVSDGALYWPDGQIREEVFEYTSFLSSRMHQEGVTCTDCHDSHSGQLLRDDDDLCLSCHAGQDGFARHDHHPDGATACVDCHMPQTTYMGRHPRRDHGFIVPDPALNVSHGVPDACTGCHADQTAAWAAAAHAAWYGTALTPRQRRSRALADASTPGGLPGLLEVATADPHPHWRATALSLLSGWLHDDRAVTVLLAETGSADDRIRAVVAGALGERVQDPAVHAALSRLASDPVRAVRVEAQRGLREVHRPDSPAAADLRAWLDRNADQPAASFALGAWWQLHGEPDEAIPLLRRAADWNPGDPTPRLSLALALTATGDPAAARGELEAAVAAVPELSAGWYLLGLLHSQEGRTEEALDALRTAQQADPTDPAPPYARATILRDAGRTDEALQAARDAHRLGHPSGPALLRQLGG